MLKNKQVAKKIRAKRKQKVLSFTVSIPLVFDGTITSPYDLITGDMLTREPETDEYGLTGFQRYLAERIQEYV